MFVNHLKLDNEIQGILSAGLKQAILIGASYSLARSYLLARSCGHDFMYLMNKMHTRNEVWCYKSPVGNF